jgi:hypothetical protein
VSSGHRINGIEHVALALTHWQGCRNGFPGRSRSKTSIFLREVPHMSSSLGGAGKTFMLTRGLIMNYATLLNSHGIAEGTGLVNKDEEEASS